MRLGSSARTIVRNEGYHKRAGRMQRPSPSGRLAPPSSTRPMRRATSPPAAATRPAISFSSRPSVDPSNHAEADAALDAKRVPVVLVLKHFVPPDDPLVAYQASRYDVAVAGDGWTIYRRRGTS